MLLTPAVAAALAESFYGFSATAVALDGEYDSNFRLETAGGERYLLKIARPGEERALLELQNEAMLHMAARAPGLVCQQVIATRSGDLIGELIDESGATRLVRLFRFLPGRLLAEVRPHTPALLESLGRTLAVFDLALADFEHRAARRKLHWDLVHADWIGEKLVFIADERRRALIEQHYRRYLELVQPRLAELPHSVIHGDANDYNVLVEGQGYEARVSSLIDFGDIVWSATICNLAIGLAYAVLDKPDPLAAAAHVVRGYHALRPLSEAELALLYPLMLTRLAASVTTSAQRKTLEPEKSYLTISEAPAWATLERCETIHHRLAHYRLREVCGYPPVPHGPRLSAWLAGQRDCYGPLIMPDIRSTPVLVLDLSIGSLDLGDLPLHADHQILGRHINRLLAEAGRVVGVGRYDESRSFYTAEAFRSEGEEGDEWRTVHLGLDLFAPPGTAVLAPLDGVVHSLGDNAGPGDYGPCIVLEHQIGELGCGFYTLYGHLSRESLAGLQVGQVIGCGEQFATIGTAEVNGGWPPHLHVQIVLDMLDRAGEFPGVARPGERLLWLGISPDPNLIAGLPAEQFPRPPRDEVAILARRRELIGPNLSVSYRRPITMVRASGAHMYDQYARRYIDAYNNVPHVGHCHPRVVRAAQRQLALLNSNTRYLHQNLVAYAERLVATFPPPLRVCYFVNSGSEANELAIRLARTYTGRQDLIISEGAYHGNTTTLVDLSPYKAEGPGGRGLAPWAHKAPLPDCYRGPYPADDPQAGRKYARAVGTLIEQARDAGRDIAAFMIESILSCGGQIILPPGYLAECYRLVHAAGGLTIADEVQTGLGRVGSHFWAFESQGVVPDIVALGKPIGNGFPLGAVVTTAEVAAAFDNGMEWFSTFGGNPVACAVGLAVLDVIADEGLQEHAHQVGNYLLSGLRRLMDHYPIIGDVRGLGLFAGIELVRDRAAREPAPAQTSYIASRMRDRQVLTGTDGVYHNVLKIKPPLPFARDDADQFIDALALILHEDGAQPF